MNCHLLEEAESLQSWPLIIQWTLNLHKYAPINSQAWMEEVINGPQASLLNYLLMINSGKGER